MENVRENLKKTLIYHGLEKADLGFEGAGLNAREDLERFGRDAARFRVNIRFIIGYKRQT